MTYNQTIIDLGTGDGRFIYKQAVSRPENLYIGIDPAPKQFEPYLKRARKNKVQNLKYIVGSLELLPPEYIGKANKVYINLPWGTLLESLIKGSSLEKILSLFKNTKAELILLLGYSPDFEPSETARLSLPELTKETLELGLIKNLADFGFTLSEFSELSQNELKKIDSSWAKKLSFGNPRVIYKLIFTRV